MRDLSAFLARARAAHQELMTEEVRLYAQGDDVFDRESGATMPGPQTTLCTGPGRVKPMAQATGTEEQAGERQVTMRDYEVSLPWGTALPAGVRVVPGHRLEVQSSTDPRMSGLVLWVTGAQYHGTASAWRIAAEDRS